MITKAYAQGRAAAFDGKDSSANHYPAGDKNRVEWRDGFHDALWEIRQIALADARRRTMKYFEKTT